MKERSHGEINVESAARDILPEVSHKQQRTKGSSGSGRKDLFNSPFNSFFQTDRATGYFFPPHILLVSHRLSAKRVRSTWENLGLNSSPTFTGIRLLNDLGP